MQMFKLIITILLMPLFAFAKEASVQAALSKGLSGFDNAWNYKVFALDNQAITVSNVVIALIALIIGMKLAKYLSRHFKKKLFALVQLDKNSANLISRIIDYLFLVIIIIIVLDIARVPLTIFTFIGGAFVVSIGLSSQHLINNFISGVVLIIEGKIRVGDLIEFETIIGRVESIESRAVEIKTQNNVSIFIPHSKLMQDSFSHWTHNGGRVRISTSFKIDQTDNDDNGFEDIILNAIAQNRSILTTPKPQLLLAGFENNIICYEVFFWINLADSERKVVISEVNHHIFNALRVHNIPFAIPSVKHIETSL